MKSLLQSYTTFIHSYRRQQGITLQMLIIDLIQEETLMKDIGSTSESTLALYVGKKFSNNSKKIYFNKNFKKFSNPKAKSNFKPYEKKEFNTIKKYFYCKKLEHVIKDCRIQIVVEK